MKVKIILSLLLGLSIVCLNTVVMANDDNLKVPASPLSIHALNEIANEGEELPALLTDEQLSAIEGGQICVACFNFNLGIIGPQLNLAVLSSNIAQGNLGVLGQAIDFGL